MSYKRTLLLDSLILVCLAAALIKPLFRLKYLDNWPSIESTFISDARMLSEHLPHPGWQPLWYCGTRTDYIYPPALVYGTALISKVGARAAGACLPPLHRLLLRAGLRGRLLARARGLGIPVGGMDGSAGRRPALAFLSGARSDAARQRFLDSRASSCPDGLRRRARTFHLCASCPPRLLLRSWRCGNRGRSRSRRRALSAPSWSPTTSMGPPRSRFCIPSWCGPSGTAKETAASWCARR